MRRELRGVLLALFLLPLLWGLITLARGASSDGVPECPGLQLGEDGESHPGPMRRGYTCAVSYSTATGRSTGTRTYDEQKYAQEQARSGLYWRGAGHVAYGTAGLLVLTATRLSRRTPR
ncbi:hypothetical protein [Streptomyces sp. AS02]|uniref:hypothetical protein n=1 Tax=Streptomyces sp. AS02 TaxID=2938946 RepID=UPI0020214351|nr:hypothetical protein [Streptomyces sp. AS02]MCL8014808.1 hypothetical protein [Streptomyces sp. AS02]